MTRAPQHSGYVGSGAADTQVGDRSQLARTLSLVVTALGLAAFGSRFGSHAVTGLAVQLATLASVVAAISLLPRQEARHWLVATLAVTGFLDALAAWITVDVPHWVVVVVLVVNGLQAVVAVVALLCDTGSPTSTEGHGGMDYWAYAQSIQAYQAYVAQYHQAAAASYGAAGQATAQAQSEARISAGAPAATRQQRPAPVGLEERYAAHGVSPSREQFVGDSAQAPTAPREGYGPGIPHANRGAAESPSARTAPRSGDATLDVNDS